jgi:hypothetical protein
VESAPWAKGCEWISRSSVNEGCEQSADDPNQFLGILSVVPTNNQHPIPETVKIRAQSLEATGDSRGERIILWVAGLTLPIRVEMKKAHVLIEQ